MRFVINTHWHFDHTGGNEPFGKGGALIVAHENVRKRMSTTQFIAAFQREIPPSPSAALPVVTFGDGVTLHWNGEEIEVEHVEAAHTDGDALVWFRNANAVHTGDTYVAGRFPFVDVSSGGSLAGIIDSAERVLAQAGPETTIIPGHGPLSNAAVLRTWREMLVTVRERVNAALAAGKSLEAFGAERPLADLERRGRTARRGPAPRSRCGITTLSNSTSWAAPARARPSETASTSARGAWRRMAFDTLPYGLSRRRQGMDFSLTEEQELLQETVRGFVAKECPPQKVRAIFDGERQAVLARWKGLSEIGIAGLAVPERHGGAGLELLELALVAEELGRGAVPVPFLGHALATLALAQGGSVAQQAKWLPRLAAGDARASVALADSEAGWLPAQWSADLANGRVRGRKISCPRRRARSCSRWAAAAAPSRWSKQGRACASTPSLRSTASARSRRSSSTAPRTSSCA